MLISATAGALWRRAIEALAHAFDPAREADGGDTVFQPRRERERAEPRAEVAETVRPPRETLQ